MKIAVYVKANKPRATEVIAYLKRHFEHVHVFSGNLSDSFPEEARELEVDITISYLSPWIIPAQVLNRTRLWNINFHTGPPEYPGIGCTNFAIFDGVKEYGITAHHMKPKVDTGDIIVVRRFPVEADDTVYSLTMKCYDYMFNCFQEVMEQIRKEQTIPQSDEQWQRKPFTRKELESLCILNFEMQENEIERRIKATTYPNMPGAYFECDGRKFEYNPER